MKFENMYIVCESVNQRNIASKVVESMGYEHMGSSTEKHELTVSCYDDGDYHHISGKAAAFLNNKHTFSEFMKKYGQTEMIDKINQAKEYFGFSDTELSLRLGHARQYIRRVLRNPQSKKVQNRVISDIELLMNKPKTETNSDNNEVARLKDDIHNLCNEKIDMGASLYAKSKNIASLKYKIDIKDEEISNLICENTSLKYDAESQKSEIADWKAHYIDVKNECAEKQVKLHILYLLVIAFLSGLFVVGKVL